MIFVGLDDTDMLDTPGTNKLAMHLARLLDDAYETQWIVRHQMLVDPRVPCTRMNGSVSLGLTPRGTHQLAALATRICEEMIAWCPDGSDPGLCIAEDAVPESVCEWGRRAQRELVSQDEALQIAGDAGVFLRPLGGTGGGIIGALAAVGLLATWNSGRVVHHGSHGERPFDVTGTLPAAEIRARGVDRILRMDTGETIEQGSIDLGKRLRPNLRGGRVVLYVLPSDSDCEATWQAQRVVA
jgi:hypothetical protein